MTMPSPQEEPTMELPTPNAPLNTTAGKMGQLFTLALLRAGRNGCECESCKHLQAIIDLMLESSTEPQLPPSRAARRRK